MSLRGPLPRERGALEQLARGLAHNLAAGFRLAAFLPLRAYAFRAAATDFATLFAFNLGVWLATAAASAGFRGALDVGAVASRLTVLPVVLGAALAIAGLYGRRDLVLLLAVALISADALFQLVGFALLALPLDAAWLGPLSLAFLAWVWTAAARAVIVCGGVGRPQVLQGVLVATAMVAMLLALPAAEPWVVPEDEDNLPALTQERLFHLQGELIERNLGALARGRGGVPELYFVGFAPDGNQDVFVREMRYAKRLFEERYGTRARSIALVNGEATLEEFPLATATNLRRTLAHAARRMNVEEDALFLFISAHGDRQHRLSAVQAPLDLEVVNPTSLARMLHDAGIKWKIIVVSACFSGGFVEPLRDDNTLVVTASAAERHSFGCETGTDFTFFGRAFFGEALARTRSFTEAFAFARESVARREASEGLEASLPQIWVGPAIEPRLAALEGRPSAAARTR